MKKLLALIIIIIPIMLFFWVADWALLFIMAMAIAGCFYSLALVWSCGYLFGEEE